MHHRERLLALTFVAPATALIVLFVFWPVANTFRTSLRHVSLSDPSSGRHCGTDNYRMARTRDAVVLAVRGIQEGIRVLRALGLPVTPKRFRGFLWAPEPLLVAVLRRLLAHEMMEVAMVRHAEAARDEVRHHVDAFRALARSTHVATPTIDRLYAHLDPDTPQMPEGSAEIPLRWGSVIVSLCVAAVTVVVGARLVRQIACDVRQRYRGRRR